MNVVVVSGNICVEPHFWLSRRGKPMLSFILAVHREPGRPQKADREADFLPVVLAGRAADDLRALVQVRTRLAVRGFVQSRNYTKRRTDGEPSRHTTLELLAERVELLGDVNWEAVEELPDSLPAAPGVDWGDDAASDWDTGIGPVRLPTAEEVRVPS